jgi:hypothetical protein
MGTVLVWEDEEVLGMDGGDGWMDVFDVTELYIGNG